MTDDLTIRITAEYGAQTVVIFERGILGWQSIFGDWKNWPNQACVWVNKNTAHKSQTLTYFTGPILAGLTRHRRARNFADMLRQYSSPLAPRPSPLIIVAHSEGTATTLLALKLAGWPRIEELHVICGACDADCWANGLNHALSSGRIGKVFIYVAGRDGAMKLEDTYIGSLCFGLQTGGQPMGLKGPENLIPAAERHTEVIHWKTFGHSDCFLPINFNNTLRQVLAHSDRTGSHLSAPTSQLK